MIISDSVPKFPKVLLVGGPDLDARLELMQALRGHFHVSAAGTAAELRDHFERAGFAYYTYPLSRRINPIADVSTLISLFLLFRRHRPDLVHAFDTKPCALARLAAKLAAVPVIVGTLCGLGSLYANNEPMTLLVRGFYEALQTLACRLSDLTIFQNYDDFGHFVEAGIVSSHTALVIPGSGVSTSRFDPMQVSETERTLLRKELGIRSGEMVVTMISRVIRSKGILEFVTAAREVTTQHPNVRFVLVGPRDHESVDRLNTEELAQLRKAVTWVGARNDIPAVLAVSDIFALPSAYREGIPRVLLEAASMGLPIITTDSPGCREVVKNDVNGFLIPTRDAVALAEAIARLIQQPELRLRFGPASRQRALARFELSVIAEQTYSVYQHLLAHRAVQLGREVS